VKPSIQAPIDAILARVATLEAELAALKRAIATAGLSSVATDGTITGNGTSPNPLSVAVLSGSIDSAIRTISSGGLTFVSTDATISGTGTGVDPLSIGPVSSSIDGSIKNSYSVLQVGLTSSVAGTSALSATVNARFLNVTGSLISGLTSTYSSLQAGSTASVAALSGTVDARFKNFNYTNIGVTGTLTVTGDLRVSGSITGSGQSLFSTALFSTAFPSGTGMHDAVRIDDTTSNTAGDGDRIRWTFNSPTNYSAWMAARLNNTSPNFLDPRIEFGIQQGGTIGLTNVTATLAINNYGIDVTGSARVQGAVTSSWALIQAPTPISSSAFIAKVIGSPDDARRLVGFFDVDGVGAQNPVIALGSNNAGNTDGGNGLMLGTRFAFQQAFLDHNFSAADSLSLMLRGSDKIRLGQSDVQFSGNLYITGSVTGSGQVLLRRSSSGLAGLGYEVLILENNSDNVLMFKGSSANEKSIYYTNPSGTADGGIVYDHPNTPRGFQVRTGGNNIRATIDNNGVASFSTNVFVTGALNVGKSNAGGTLSVRPANNNADGIFMDQAGGYTASMVYEGTGGDLGGWGFTFKPPSNATTQVDVLKIRGDRRVYVSGALLVSGSVDGFQVNVHRDLIVTGSAYIAGNLYTTGNLVTLGNQIVVGITTFQNNVTADLGIFTVSGSNIVSDGDVEAKFGYITGPSGSSGYIFLGRTILTGSQTAGSAQRFYNWTPNPGTRGLLVKMVGGGGGGAGSAASSAGSGGGSGLYWEGYFGSEIIPTLALVTASVWVGSGGVTGSSGGGAGGTGGDTAFAINGFTYLTKGGLGGSAGTGAGGGLGTGWTTAVRGNTVIISGEPGDGAIVATGGALAGKGGNNPLGVGGTTSTTTGVAGRGFGGGGGGGTGANSGGSGSWGAVVIDEYG
jgi:hypothetical protein